MCSGRQASLPYVGNSGFAFSGTEHLSDKIHIPAASICSPAAGSCVRLAYP